jgi:hypothetical protein
VAARAGVVPVSRLLGISMRELSSSEVVSFINQNNEAIRNIGSGSGFVVVNERKYLCIISNHSTFIFECCEPQPEPVALKPLRIHKEVQRSRGRKPYERLAKQPLEG